MLFSPAQIVALVIAASFAAGLNVYATVGTLGILARLDWIVLPPGLHSLGETWVIVVAASLFSVEFFADKIPVFDVFWNAAHTFVRVPVAALLAYKATTQLSPVEQLLAASAGAAIAALAHTSKTAACVLVTPSPEPVSNVVLSAAEDGTAIGLTWLATRHPYTAAGLVLAAFVLLALSIRRLAQQLRRTGSYWRTETESRLRLWRSH